MNNSEYAPQLQVGRTASENIDLMAEALEYAAKGWPVFPCKPDKSPYVAGGFNAATDNPDKIRSWWTRWPEAMIAVPTGAAIGAWVLDIDDEAEFATVAADLHLPATRTSRTGKGRHLFFAWDEAEPVRNGAKGTDLPGADVRGEGGYVIVPPSKHPSGARYTWDRDEDASEASAELMSIIRVRGRKRPHQPEARKIAALPTNYPPIRVQELGLRLEGPGPVSVAARLALTRTPKGQRSEAVNRFVAEAIREGWTDLEIGGTLMHRDNAISERILEQRNPLREIQRAISHFRGPDKENTAEHELPHIRDYPVIDWAAFISSASRSKSIVAANDTQIGIVRTDPEARRRSSFEFVRVGELEHREPDWLVDDLIEAASLALIFGDPGSGKSFVAIDLAACVATGTPFHGRAVAKGGVFYIAGEGHSGLRRRFTAWEQGAGLSLNEAPLFTSKGPANFLDADSAERVAQAVEALATGCPPRLIIVDTLARNFGDGDENSTKDMNAFVAAMDELRGAYPDATVLIVHHSGHGDKSRARGAMALKGALDAEYQISKKGDLVSLISSKMKEAAPPPLVTFQLVPVELGTDRKGQPFGSARLRLIESIKTGKPAATLGGNALMVANAYRDVAATRAAAGLGEGVPRGEWRAAFSEAYGNPDSARAIFSKQVKILCDEAPTDNDALCFLRAEVAASIAAA